MIAPLQFLHARPRLATALAATTCILLGHVWSVKAGLFLDDHAHYRQLKEGDWSFQSAVDSARLGIVGDIMDLWSHQEAGLRFFRPIAFWVMRAEYTLVDWQPAWMHCFSIGWHWIVTMLVASLAFHCLGSRFWAGIAACLFAVHPGNVVTVYWIATQTELMVVACILSATLCYARFSAWPRPLFDGAFGVSQPPSTGNVLWLLAALTFFALALGCRENAVAFPMAAFATDLITGRIRFRSRWWAYLAMTAVVAAYAFLRHHALGGFPLPARPYMIRPTDPGFFLFAIDKVMYYLLGLFAYVPVIPIGGQAYLHQHPLAFYGSFAGLCAGLLLIAFAFRRDKGLLFAPLWIIFGILPVLPVFASAHHLYLPSVGAILILTAGLARLAGLMAPPTVPVARPRKWIASVVLAAHLGGFTYASYAYGWAYRTGTSTEDMIVEDVASLGRPIKPGDHIFFINIPMLAYYTVPALEQYIGVRPLHGHILTFSPNILYPETPARVTLVAPGSIEVYLPQDVYFAGTAGKALLEMMGLPTELAVGQVIDGNLFTTTVLEKSADGIKRLRFDFKSPLTRPDFHFFLCSSSRMAYPIPIAPSPAAARATNP